MSWIYGNRYLTAAEMENNAVIIYTYLNSRGWSLNAIAGMLGNMESESGINPGIWQSLNEGNYSGGFGLVQWTPASNYTVWALTHNYSITDGYGQLYWIDNVTVEAGQWIATSDYPLSFAEFKVSTETPQYLASAFLKNFERAGVEVELERRNQANYWYNFLLSSGTRFTPRLDSTGIEGSFYYYSQNPFYLSGYGMPNCTCYAWGRFWEISDTDGNGSNKPTLHTGDAGQWFGVSDGYERGSEPRLGAVVCWSHNEGGAGHVGIVEQILDNGDIVTSNSNYSGTFWYLMTNTKANNYNLSNQTFQGFIYNPYVTSGQPITPGGRRRKRKGFNFVLFNKQRRLIK